MEGHLGVQACKHFRVLEFSDMFWTQSTLQCGGSTGRQMVAVRPERQVKAAGENA